MEVRVFGARRGAAGKRLGRFRDFFHGDDRDGFGEALVEQADACGVVFPSTVIQPGVLAGPDGVNGEDRWIDG